MTNSQRLAKVRARFLQWIDSQPCDPADPPPAAIEESDSETHIETQGETRAEFASAEAGGDGATILREAILIRDGFFCGRRFYGEHHHAVWFIEEDELKIFDDRDQLLCVLAGHEWDEEADVSQGAPAPEILKLPELDQPTIEADTNTRRAA